MLANGQRGTAHDTQKGSDKLLERLMAQRETRRKVKRKREEEGRKRKRRENQAGLSTAIEEGPVIRASTCFRTCPALLCSVGKIELPPSVFAAATENYAPCLLPLDSPHTTTPDPVRDASYGTCGWRAAGGLGKGAQGDSSPMGAHPSGQTMLELCLAVIMEAQYMTTGPNTHAVSVVGSLGVICWMFVKISAPQKTRQKYHSPEMWGAFAGCGWCVAGFRDVARYSGPHVTVV